MRMYSFLKSLLKTFLPSLKDLQKTNATKIPAAVIKAVFATNTAEKFGILPRLNLLGRTPKDVYITNAVMLEIKTGSTAERHSRVKITSSTKTQAARGVPNTAENRAAIPHITDI